MQDIAVVIVLNKNQMNNLNFRLEKLLDVNFKAIGLDSIQFRDHLKKEIISELTRDYNNNLINLLEFCKIVEKEKNGLLFIEKMIESLILENNQEISKKSNV